MSLDRAVRIAAIMVCFAALTLAPFPAGADSGTRETFTGAVVPTGGAGARATMQFTLYLDSYCTDAERAALRAAFVSGGQEGLLKALRKKEVGRIMIGPRTGYPIAAAISIPTETGRRIIAVTERPIQMAEFYSGSGRSMDYKFGFILFELEGDKATSGQIVLAAQLVVDKSGQLEIESFGVNPLRMMGVQKR